jgi:hypothetical protein
MSWSSSSREHTFVGAPHEVGEQGELAPGQAHRSIRGHSPAAVQVQLYAAGLDVALLTGPRWRRIA